MIRLGFGLGPQPEHATQVFSKARDPSATEAFRSCRRNEEGIHNDQKPCPVRGWEAVCKFQPDMYIDSMGATGIFSLAAEISESGWLVGGFCA